MYYNALTAFKNSLESIFGKTDFKELHIKDINEGICKQVFDNWAKFQTWSAHTRRTYRDKVSVFFDAFKNIVPTNPVSKNTRIKATEKNRNLPLADEDLKKIISHLENSDKKNHKELLGFALLMYTGLLRGDTIYKLKCINFKQEDKINYYIEVYSKIVKNKISGRVIIPKYVIDYLINKGIYNPAQPENLLFPPTFKQRANKSSKANRQRKGEHLRNRMWASNLWNYVLTKELGYSNEFAILHNVYCLKPTGALYLYNIEKWDIREISAQMLHAHLITTFIYIDRLKWHNADRKKRVFRHQILEKKGVNLANTENSPQTSFSERDGNISEINHLTQYSNR